MSCRILLPLNPAHAYRWYLLIRYYCMRAIFRFYRNTQGNILHFNNSIFHVYSHSVELKLSDILLTEAHTLEALYWEFYNGGPLKIKRNISIYFIDGIIVFSFFHRLNWLFNLFGCDLYVGGGRVREIDISLNIFCTVACLQHQMWNRKYMSVLI